IARRPDLNQRGRFFILIGRSTFSSAMDNARDFQTSTSAVLVGLPTGGKPNSFGEVRTLTLPSSGATLQYSTKAFRRDPDNRPAVFPDLQVDPTAADFFSPRDPTLEAALRFQP